MSAYQPPTENVPIFDSSNFYTNLDNPLTIRDGLKYFLSYPNAQGTQNFTDMVSNGIAQFTNNLRTSFLSGIIDGGTFYIDADENGGDIVITSKTAGSKTIIQRDEGGTITNCATFEYDGITARLFGTSDYTYSVFSPEGVLNGSIMYDDGTYSRYLSNAGTLIGQALITGGEGVLPYWGNPESCTSAVYADNISGGSLGRIPYQASIDNTLFTTVGTNGQSLMSGGGVIAPFWANNLGYVSEVNAQTASGATDYTLNTAPLLTNCYNTIIYFTGWGARRLQIPNSLTPPNGTSFIIVNKTNSTVSIYRQDYTITTNLIISFASPTTTNFSTTGGTFAYYTETGWIKIN